jgi:hypothetical protein
MADADNPVTESKEVNVNEAVALFDKVFNPVEETKETTEEVKEEPKADPEKPTEVVEESTEDDPLVTVKIDGKEVEVKLSELKNGYQRQSDYTRKTMEVSEQRKTAEAETQKAHQERADYAQNLQKMAIQLEGALQEQQKTDWDALLQSDPVEYLKQQHLFQQRQATLQQNLQEQQKVAVQAQAEQQKAYQSHLVKQQEELLAKLPEWKDEAKAKADKAAMRDYLIKQGYDDSAINAVADHRAVVMARKAMLYDQMIDKAKVAAKQVSKLPQKVERPGTGSNPGLDKRSAVFQKLEKSGSVEDAAAAFGQIFNN